MQYDRLGQFTAEDLRRVNKNIQSNENRYFAWRPEYLPIVIVGLGISGIIAYRELKKKRKKK